MSLWIRPLLHKLEQDGFSARGDKGLSACLSEKTRSCDFTNTYHDRRILRKKTDGWRYTILKKTASETKYNTGYNSRLEVKHFAVSAVGVGQFAASSDVYLIFKHF